MTLDTLRALLDRQTRREARIWADAKRVERLADLHQLKQVLAHGPPDAEWELLAVAEERRMRLALDAKRAWREADVRAPPDHPTATEEGDGMSAGFVATGSRLAEIASARITELEEAVEAARRFAAHVEAQNAAALVIVRRMVEDGIVPWCELHRDLAAVRDALGGDTA